MYHFRYCIIDWLNKYILSPEFHRRFLKIFPKNEPKNEPKKIKKSLEYDHLNKSGRDPHPRYILTKFEENLSKGFGKEVENVIVDGRTTDERQRQ